MNQCFLKTQQTPISIYFINFDSDEKYLIHAKNVDEENKLIEAGFEYLRYSDKFEVAIYRKRK